MTQGLSVVGTGHRSLFDAAEPNRLQHEGTKRRGPGGMVLACLHDPGVTGGVTRARDAVVMGGRAFGSPLEGWVDTAEADAIGIAYGIASVRSRRAAGSSTWCLVRTGVFEHGPALEALAQLAGLAPVGLVVIAVGPSHESTRTFALAKACGLSVHSADNTDALSVLGALDHALGDSTNRTAVVVATKDAR